MVSGGVSFPCADAVVTGKSASTLYYPFWVHTNGSGTDSAVTAGTSYTTSAAAATAVTLSGPTAGAVGVAHVLRLLRDEFEIAMALCGCERVEQISSALIANAIDSHL